MSLHASRAPTQPQIKLLSVLRGANNKYNKQAGAKGETIPKGCLRHHNSPDRLNTMAVPESPQGPLPNFSTEWAGGRCFCSQGVSSFSNWLSLF